MKTILALLLNLAAAYAEPMNKKDRQQVVAHLEMTGNWLGDEVAKLSPAQLQFRPGGGTWNIKDILEHLAIAEPQYWTDFQTSVKETTEAKSEVSDADILWYGIDRTERTKTGEAREPKQQFETAAQAFDSWKKLRKTMLEYATTTEDDLRARRYKKSQMDAYQWLLMISTHSQRHILQIREIKHHADYPAK